MLEKIFLYTYELQHFLLKKFDITPSNENFLFINLKHRMSTYNHRIRASVIDKLLSNVRI